MDSQRENNVIKLEKNSILDTGHSRTGPFREDLLRRATNISNKLPPAVLPDRNDLQVYSYCKGSKTPDFICL